MHGTTQAIIIRKLLVHSALQQVKVIGQPLSEQTLNSICTVGTEFVVNDSPWFGRSGDRVTPRVVNTADYISRGFSKFLEEQRGWTREKVITDRAVAGVAAAEDQRIDASIELPASPGYALDRVELFPFLDEFTAAHPELEPDRAAVLFYQRYGRRGCFHLGALEERHRHHFRQAQTTGPIRVGVEFETGYIASSFRSLNKLGFLYRRGLIDAGVFITSRDKASATRIWPATTRNGSFEELERLQYRDSIVLPIWEFGFAPDRFGRTAPYLGKTRTYTMTNTGDVETVGGVPSQVWEGNAKRFLRRAQPST